VIERIENFAMHDLSHCIEVLNHAARRPVALQRTAQADLQAV
jgi:hypothetical protein